MKAKSSAAKSLTNGNKQSERFSESEGGDGRPARAEAAQTARPTPHTRAAGKRGVRSMDAMDM